MNKDQAKTTLSSLNGSSLSYSLVPRTSFSRAEDIPCDDTTLLMLSFIKIRFCFSKDKLQVCEEKNKKECYKATRSSTFRL